MSEVSEVTETDSLEACPKIGQFLNRLADKWSVMVLIALSLGPQRFSALKRSLTRISQRMLTLTLKNLERDGLVKRTVTPSTPPRVDYELTDLGRSVCGPLRSLGGWIATNLATIDAARSRYDGDKPLDPNQSSSLGMTPGRSNPAPGDGHVRSGSVAH